MLIKLNMNMNRSDEVCNVLNIVSSGGSRIWVLLKMVWVCLL